MYCVSVIKISLVPKRILVLIHINLEIKITRIEVCLDNLILIQVRGLLYCPGQWSFMVA